MKRFFFDCGTREASASQGLLVLRVMIGLMMLIGHGLPKIQHFGEMRELFYVPSWFILHWLTPQMSLIGCIVAEVGASALLVLGLATRPAAFVLAFNMVVAVFGAMHGAAWFVAPPAVTMAKELGLLYLIPMLALIISGAGAISLDAVLYREKRRRW